MYRNLLPVPVSHMGDPKTWIPSVSGVGLNHDLRVREYQPLIVSLRRYVSWRRGY